MLCFFNQVGGSPKYVHGRRSLVRSVILNPYRYIKNRTATSYHIIPHHTTYHITPPHTTSHHLTDDGRLSGPSRSHHHTTTPPHHHTTTAPQYHTASHTITHNHHTIPTPPPTPLHQTTYHVTSTPHDETCDVRNVIFSAQE